MILKYIQVYGQEEKLTGENRDLRHKLELLKKDFDLLKKDLELSQKNNELLRKDFELSQKNNDLELKSKGFTFSQIAKHFIDTGEDTLSFKGEWTAASVSSLIYSKRKTNA
jgi:predicted RNase H-like nuclease (RuvC/YqgF family)